MAKRIVGYRFTIIHDNWKFKSKEIYPSSREAFAYGDMLAEELSKLFLINSKECLIETKPCYHDPYKTTYTKCY